MELRSGYKKTEVGVIPGDWECTDVRRIASSARNAIVGGPFGSDLVSADYVEDGVPVIRGQNMSGQWVSGTFVFVTPKKAKLLDANLARPGDIVFTQRGTLGQVGLVPDQPFQTYLVSQSQMKLSLDRETADPLFFYYVFSSDEQQGLIREGTIQTGVPHINLGILRGIPVLRPPLEEQRAIAAALSDVDALIGALDKLIAKKRDLKQAAMQQLLTGRTRLPGFGGDWQALPLKQVVRQFIVPMRDKPGRLDGEIPWCRIEDFEGIFLTRSKSGQGVGAATIQAMNLKVYPPGTLLVSCSADLGRCAIAARPLVSNQTFIGLEMDADVASNVFFYFLMTSRAGELNNLSSGTTISYLSRQQFEEFKVFVPIDKSEQVAIAHSLTDMDAELAALDARREKTRALKQGMMQELLTGRIRLVPS